MFEALSGGSFATRMNQEWVYNSSGVPATSWNEFNRNFNFHQCEASLKKTRPILVGHNLFQDLAFIYHTFFDPLPHRVDEFLAKIHELFPRIVDTKFMYTAGRHMMEPDRNLEELQNSYIKWNVPIRHGFKSHHNIAGPHDAGFDSKFQNPSLNINFPTNRVRYYDSCFVLETDLFYVQHKETLERDSGGLLLAGNARYLQR